MSLTIFVDQAPGHTFSRDQTITGRVQLDSDRNISLGLVHVGFIGRCEVEITRRRSSGTGTNQTSHTDYYRSKGYYFYFSQVLYQGTHMHKAGQFSWPFQFTFPSVAAPGLVQGPERATTFHPKPPYRATGDNLGAGNPHYLPTSLDLGFDRRIRYYLEAYHEPAEGRTGIFHKGIRQAADLPFIHRNPWGFFVPQSMIHYCDCEIKSFKLLPSSLGRGDSFRDKWKSKFNTSSTPCARFRVIATFPPALSRNFQDIVPCTIQLERLPVQQGPKCEYSNEQILLERVKIRKMELRLHGQTIMRAEGYEDTHYDRVVLMDVDDGPEICVDYSRYLESEGGKNHGSQVMPMDLGHWGQIRLPFGVPESFSTYNFVTFYHVSLKLTIECGGENIKCKPLDMMPFEVMPIG